MPEAACGDFLLQTNRTQRVPAGPQGARTGLWLGGDGILDVGRAAGCAGDWLDIIGPAPAGL